MRFLAAFWGAVGIFALLFTALYRLTPIAWDIFDYSLQWYHYLILAINVLFMAHSEGYRGFQKSFSPRVTARVHYLSQNATWGLLPFAPFFCMGYFRSSRKTQIITISLTSFIIVLILILRYIPQPWRGIIDWGVVVGLTWGVISLMTMLLHTFVTQKCVYDADVPA